VKTVIGANSHRQAIHTPPMRCNAQAASPDAACAAIAVDITMGNPSAPKPAISSGRPGKNATSSGSR